MNLEDSINKYLNFEILKKEIGEAEQNIERQEEIDNLDVLNIQIKATVDTLEKEKRVSEELSKLKIKLNEKSILKEEMLQKKYSLDQIKEIINSNISFLTQYGIIKIDLTRFEKNKREWKQLEKATEYCARSHSDTKRKRGDYYLTHPLNVKKKIYETLEKKTSIELLIGALLHDVPEEKLDYKKISSLEEEFKNIERNLIKWKFNKEKTKKILNILKLLTHDKSLTYKEYLNFEKRMPYADKKTIESAYIIKLADRINNTQSLNKIPTNQVTLNELVPFDSFGILNQTYKNLLVIKKSKEYLKNRVQSEEKIAIEELIKELAKETEIILKKELRYVTNNIAMKYREVFDPGEELIDPNIIKNKIYTQIDNKVTELFKELYAFGSKKLDEEVDKFDNIFEKNEKLKKEFESQWALEGYKSIDQDKVEKLKRKIIKEMILNKKKIKIPETLKDEIKNINGQVINYVNKEIKNEIYEKKKRYPEKYLEKIQNKYLKIFDKKMGKKSLTYEDLLERNSYKENKIEIYKSAIILLASIEAEK